MTAREKIAYRFCDGTLSMDWYIQQRRRFAEMERQAQGMGGTAFGVGQFYRGQPQ